MMTKKTGRGGMALAVILIALFVFSIIMFAIATQQQHETRFTAISLEQQRAFVLADAGLARAMARHVARTYHNRWYGPPPGQKDDALPELEHAGRFNESSQSIDDAGGKLDPNGTYSVLVEDRHAGELHGADPTASTRLAFTDVFSKGTIDGPHGPVSALLFARLAIAPEPNFFSQTESVTPTLTPDESTPELVKRIIRYKVYFGAEEADHAYETPNQDTAEMQRKVGREIALFHQNFLKNRNTFADLRDPAKVGPTWNENLATTPQLTQAQVDGMFAGIAGPEAVPGGSSAPDANPGTFANLWIEHMLKKYRVSDLVPVNTGIKYVVGEHPNEQDDRVARNILTTFHEGTPFEPIDPDFKPDAEPGVTTGDQYVQKQGSQANTSLTAVAYNTEISSFKRLEATATILKGHWKPYPPPPPPASPAPSPAPPPPTERPATDYADSAYKDLFLGGTTTASTDDEMKAECDRVNGMTPPPEPPVNKDLYILSNPPGDKYYPYYLRYKGVNGQPAPTPTPLPPNTTGAPPTTNPGTTHVQLSIPELCRFYAKYIETGAVFSDGNPGTITPVPPVPTTPPPNRPPPSGNGNGGNTTPGGGGSRPGGYGIGGGASSR